MKKGEKYIIELDEIIKTDNGFMARVKPFRTLTFDEYGLSQLQKVSATDNTRHMVKLLDKVAELTAQLEIQRFNVAHLVFMKKQIQEENKRLKETIKKFGLLEDDDIWQGTPLEEQI